MPSQVDDVKGALSQFQVEFCNRYGGGPNFVADTIQAVMHKAFGTEARKRKLLGNLKIGDVPKLVAMLRHRELHSIIGVKRFFSIRLSFQILKQGIKQPQT